MSAGRWGESEEGKGDAFQAVGGLGCDKHNAIVAVCTPTDISLDLTA